MDKKAIIEKLALTGVTDQSSDTAVLDAAVAKFSGLSSQVSTLQEGQKDFVKTTATAMITARATELNTTFTELQKTQFMNVAEKSGIDVLTTVLASMNAVPNITNMTDKEKKESGNGGENTIIAEDRKGWNLATWNDKDPVGLSKLSNSTKPEEVKAFQAIYKTEFPDAVFQ